MTSKDAQMLRRIHGLLTRRERLQVLGFLVLMLIGATLEVVGVSLVLPFIQIISTPEIIQTNNWLSRVYLFLQFESERSFLVGVGLLLLFVYFAKNLFFLGFYHLQNQFLRVKKVALAKEMMSFYMRMPYSHHLNHNTNQIVYNMHTATRLVDAVLLSLMIIVTELTVMGVILTLLFVIQPVTTVLAILIVGGAAVGLYKLIRKKIASYTARQFVHSVKVTKTLYEALGGIKEIKVLGREDHFIRTYIEHYNAEAALSQYTNTVNQAPRLFMEMILVGGVMAFVTAVLLTNQPTAGLIPSLALFAVAALRLMPSVNRVLVSTIMYRQGSDFVGLVDENIKDIRQVSLPAVDERSGNSFKFDREIELRGLTYQYGGVERPAVDGVSLTITKGQSVAFVGQSGAGKTTIVDVMLGLLSPTKGAIYVDGVDVASQLAGWQRKLGYIPQQIYLADDTVRRNIAFGVDDAEIDDKRIWEALEGAQLASFIRTLPEGLNTVVGERGVRLSGGQRQRIGIARCLYGDSEILIMDEATSALDNETEQGVVQAIEKLTGTKTIIVIAHRLSTVAKCQRLFFMNEGRVVDSGTFSQLLEKNRDFAQFAKV